MKLTKNKPKHLCPAYRCKKSKADRKRFCHKHHHVHQKETNLAGYTYMLLKCNAKRRGKVFTITLQDFKAFCEETNYLVLKGKKANSASIDRINPSLGYEKGNLQVLSLSANVSKHYEDSKCPF